MQNAPEAMNPEAENLDQCTLTFGDDKIVHLHLKENETIDVPTIAEIFRHINSRIEDRCGLLVTVGKSATLTQEARELVSSPNVTDKVVGDAIIVADLKHEMTANFFVRFTHPKRPTRLFKHEEEAREWLLQRIAGTA